MHVWDQNQIYRFLEDARSSAYFRLYLAAITTGMRQGELLALRWQDVDLIRGTAQVRQTFYRLGKEHLFKEPKSDKSRRSIPLPSFMVEELLTLREEQEKQRQIFGDAYEDHDLIFCQADGKPLHAQNIVRRDFKATIKKAGLPVIRFHDLRHCHATILLHHGVHPKVVSERLGHSGIAITMDIYSHVLPGIQEQAVQILQNMLSGKNVANPLLIGETKLHGT